MKKIFFFINFIPPDYGGGYLRVFRTAIRFKNYNELFKIGTLTHPERFTDGMGGISRADIFWGRGKVLSSFFVLPWYMIKHKLEYDVFYVASTHWYTVFPSLIARFLHKEIVLGVTLSMVDSPAVRPTKLLKRQYYRYKNIQFRWANYIFVNSPLLVNECKGCGYGEDVVKLINNPVDTCLFHRVTKEKQRKLRMEKGLDPDQFTILFVGSINRRKGCDLLPIIFRELFTLIDYKITFVMCGQVGYPESEGIISCLNSIFVEHGSQLIVNEQVADPFVFYQISDLFLFPTTNEGMPNVILEAMSSGCMILANTLEGITDYVLEKECLVKHNDTKEYVKKIIDFSLHPHSYSYVISKNRERIEADFSITSVDWTIQHLLFK